MKPFGLKGKAVTCKYGCCFMYPEENAFSTAKKIVRRKQRKAERQAVKKYQPGHYHLGQRSCIE